MLDGRVRVHRARRDRQDHRRDVAAASGVSRATIYRLFPGGQRRAAPRDGRLGDGPLLRSSSATELGDAARLRRPSSSGRCRWPGAQVLEHAVLQKVLETEPERLLPLITVRAAPRDLGVHRRLLPPAPRAGPGRRAASRPGVDLGPARRVRRPDVAVAHRLARAATTSTTPPRSAASCAASCWGAS